MGKDAKSERFELRLAADDLAALDDLRRTESDIPVRSEMVRRLIQRAAAKHSARTDRGKR